MYEYAKWRGQLTTIQRKIDKIEEIFYNKLNDESLTSEEIKKLEERFEVDRAAAVEELEDHFLHEPMH